MSTRPPRDLEAVGRHSPRIGLTQYPPQRRASEDSKWGTLPGTEGDLRKPQKPQSGGVDDDYLLPDRLKLLNGFPRTARFVAADPSKSLVIIRRFDEAAIRNLLLLEGRVAALEATQKQLDEDDYISYKTNDTMIKAASSWEDFALLGSLHEDEQEMPEALVEAWCTSRLAVLEQRVMKDASLPEELRDDDYNDMQYALYKQRAIQEEVDECNLKLRSLSRPPKDYAEMTSFDYSRHRRDILSKRRSLVLEKRHWLGYKENEILEVRRRWEVAKALEWALREYQEAVLRYRDMMKLEEPAYRSDDLLSKWVSGKIETNPNTQQPSRQFLANSAMDGVYQQGKPPRRRPLARLFFYIFFPWQMWYELLRFRSDPRSPPSNHKETKESIEEKPGPFVHDRVTIGGKASNDHLSHFISRRDFILRWGRDSKFEYPEVNYVPEGFLKTIVTSIVLLFSAVLLVGAIWFLWLVSIKQPWESAQLGLLTFFIIAFGFALNFMTTASKDQVFAATAAYAAVLVVFVGANNSPTGG